MKAFYCLFVFALSPLGITNAQEPLTRAGYGDSCGKYLRCDTSLSLVCRNGTCDCLRADSMFYDPIIKSCLVLVGEKCRYPVGPEIPEESLKQNWIPPHRRNLMEELDCVQNAWCNPAGLCMCSGDYLELGNGTCITKRNFEETCSNDMECRQDRFLSCIGSRCGCNETTSSYNVLLRQCVGKVGSPCLGLDACVYNSECTTSSSGGGQRRRARQSVKICTCAPGFIADPHGFCKMGLGGKCSETQTCAPNFKCKDGLCTCPFENLQVAQVRSQTCSGLVGAPCNDTGSSASYCVTNSHCSINDSVGVNECRCDDGFVEGIDGQCDLAYGSSCAMPKAQDVTPGYQLRPWENPVKCDRIVPLHCVDGKCQCESDLYAFDGVGSCVGKHGAKCTRYPTPTKSQCVDGAECLGTREATNMPYGKCVCALDQGYTVTTNRTCVKT